ncbi:MAG TPA: prolipoprotein diacylglyceryl transferase [Thermoflexales bacterium]|nr:prolipoprotein diacylglyceryl transferase [Thermoflexales bacterium]HQZ98795.1 prolipoprotein diacylglyceryl transferase [Thermoflexales bacterium]
MDPRVAIDLGFWKIHWYGIIITASMMMAIFIITLEARRRGENPNIIADNALWVILAGVVGARLYHVFSTPNDGSGTGLNYYLQNPLQILAVWNGGLGIFGALIFGLVAVVVVILRNKLRLMRWLDMIVPGVILAQAIARWGNYVNQELYGGPTGSNLWGILIDAPYRIKAGQFDFTDLDKYPLNTRFHPTFFYESMWNLAGFILMMLGGRRLKNVLRDGDLAGFYFIWYGIGRGWIELLFRPDAWTIGALPTAVWVSLALIVVGVIVIMANHARPRTEADVWPIDK